MNTEWTIQGRADRCLATDRPFADGEHFYTLLFEEPTTYRREDLSEEAFKARPEDAPKPYSFWRSKFEMPVVVPEALGKQTAEDLLRRYMEDPSPQWANVRYILAVMLERKRIFREIEVKTAEDGRMTRIYEHAKNGEVFLIPDPQLRLDQLAEVQTELAGQLA